MAQDMGKNHSSKSSFGHFWILPHQLLPPFSFYFDTSFKIIITVANILGHKHGLKINLKQLIGMEMQFFLDLYIWY